MKVKKILTNPKTVNKRVMKIVNDLYTLLSSLNQAGVNKRVIVAAINQKQMNGLSELVYNFLNNNIPLKKKLVNKIRFQNLGKLASWKLPLEKKRKFLTQRGSGKVAVSKGLLNLLKLITAGQMGATAGKALVKQAWQEGRKKYPRTSFGPIIGNMLGR